MSNSSYFDAATAAPPHPVTRQALLAAMKDGWTDPRRLYGQARKARQLLDAARESLAEQFSVGPEELRIYGSGSAAAAMAVSGLLAGRRRAGNVFVHSVIEHSAVLRTADRHTEAGGTSESVPVDRHGVVDIEEFGRAVGRPGVAGAALLSASHEVGTIQPLSEAAAACEAAGVPLYTDAAASVAYGEIPTEWSLMSASARKWGGPAGVGVLAVRAGVRWSPPAEASWAELGQPNVALVVAAAATLRAHRADLAQHTDRLRRLTARLRDRIAADVADVEVPGHPDDRLPHIVTFSCLYLDGEALVHALSRHGFAVSSGSACADAEQRPSHVLAAMGALTHGNVRVSLHTGVTDAEVERFLAILPGVVAELRERGGTGTL
ncbi:MAG: cysteine desulfurase family protein [Mycobacteriales bacterium]